VDGRKRDEIAKELRKSTLEKSLFRMVALTAVPLSNIYQNLSYIYLSKIVDAQNIRKSRAGLVYCYKSSKAMESLLVKAK